MNGGDVCIVTCVERGGVVGVRFSKRDGGVFMPLWDLRADTAIEEC